MAMVLWDGMRMLIWYGVGIALLYVMGMVLMYGTLGHRGMFQESEWEKLFKILNYPAKLHGAFFIAAIHGAYDVINDILTAKKGALIAKKAAARTGED